VIDQTWLAGAIFVVAYALIAIERWDRTLVALLGAMLVIVLGVLDQHEAFLAIDFNVIFLLAGMMVIASVLARTGFFEWLAIRSVTLSRGHPMRLLFILATLTAVVSAFLDNVTTVVLMTPIIMSVARRLDVSPFPYLIALILASNIGGTATLIGDPPNIMIASASGLGFWAFLLNLGPAIVLVHLAFLGILWVAFRRSLTVPTERREAALEATEEQVIQDRPLLIRTLVVTGATVVGFLVHTALGLEPATIALLGATVLMLVAPVEPHRAFREIEWSTLFFFVGLFILVEAIVQVGIVGGIANALADATGGDTALASIALLWFSTFVSAIVDNIPYTATAIPIVQRLGEGGHDIEVLWWALAFGACLGGNLTIVGASANVVVSNLAARADNPIRFFAFLKYGAATVAASLAITTVYLWARYLA
jgi:Na+/H+ antiporter NhaD/arsenite permease-like protein